MAPMHRSEDETGRPAGPPRDLFSELEETLEDLRREFQQRLSQTRDDMERRIAQANAEMAAREEAAAQANAEMAAREEAVERANAEMAAREEAVERANAEMAAREEVAARANAEMAAREEAAASAAAAAAVVAPMAELDAGEEALAALLGAAAAIDRGRSQAEILDSLLDGARPFASRAALFLTTSGGAAAWGAREFVDAAGAFAPERLAGWADLASGRGAVILAGDDLATIGGAAGAPEPQAAILIPLVLHDRIAAALYGDQTAGGPALRSAALQLLAHIAALALETLPLRARAATPTLRGSTQAPAGETGLPLWDPDWAASAAGVDVAPAITPAGATEPWIEPTPEPGMETAGFEAEADLWSAEPPLPLAPEELSPDGSAEPVLEIEPLDAAADLGFVEEPAETPIAEPPAAEEPALAEPVGAEPWVEDAVFVPRSHLEELPAEPVAPPAGDADDARQATTFAEPEAEPEPAPATPAAPAAAPPEPSPSPFEPSPGRGREAVEVLPPTDLRGPGSAFTGARAGSAKGDEALHEDARRLARLLVNEILLYNEDAVRRGRRERNLYHLLRDEIDRSQEVYVARVDERIRAGSDYFDRELVRILAAGDPEALGR